MGSNFALRYLPAVQHFGIGRCHDSYQHNNHLTSLNAQAHIHVTTNQFTPSVRLVFLTRLGTRDYYYRQRLGIEDQTAGRIRFGSLAPYRQFPRHCQTHGRKRIFLCNRSGRGLPYSEDFTSRLQVMVGPDSASPSRRYAASGQSAVDFD